MNPAALSTRIKANVKKVVKREVNMPIKLSKAITANVLKSFKSEFKKGKK